MRKRSKLPVIIAFATIWMICTAISMFLGYCIAGAIPETNVDLGYGGRFLLVLSTPLAGHFNEYSPISMISGFILCEVIFCFIFLVMYNRKHSEEAETLNEYLNLPKPKPDDEIEFFILDDDKKAVKEEKEAEYIEDEEEVIIQEKVFLELFNKGYSMEQISEMMVLTKYIKELDVGMLSKMFRPNMSPGEIKKHIEVFYG